MRNLAIPPAGSAAEARKTALHLLVEGAMDLEQLAAQRRDANSTSFLLLGKAFLADQLAGDQAPTV